MLVSLTGKRASSASVALSKSSFVAHLVHQEGAYTGRRPARRHLSFACGFFRRSAFPASDHIIGNVGIGTLYRSRNIYTNTCIEIHTTCTSRSTTASRSRSPTMQRKDPCGWWILSAATVSLIWSGSFHCSYCTSTTTVMALSSSNAANTKNNSKSNNQMLPRSSVFASLQLDNSWPRLLSPETSENLQKSRLQERLTEHDDNRTKRPVFNGHYVLVKPTGLKNPKLLLVSNDVAHNLLHLSEAQVNSDDFVQFVSGNVGLEESWATPYALSIMGTRYQSNCPYGTGNGYGDGRAISIAEWNGYELQLKGAGRTPFHRGADGRAVLRSSIREFLASEAMHHLGVATTRALSLIKSNVDTVMRPWYSGDIASQLPSMDDPRLAQYSKEQRRQIIQQLRTQKADPNIMIKEQCAITCRVASSFTRIGHLDLMARRVEAASLKNLEQTNKRYDTSTNEWKELEQLIWHACYREFREDAYDPFVEDKDLPSAANKLLELSSERLAAMVSDWIRVGFAQGNFNADNCLVGGKTMDYGPFGFLEEFNPLFAKWTGSGKHFGFLNQPSAGLANYQVLVESVVPVIVAARDANEDPDKTIEKFMLAAQDTFQRQLDETFRCKLGLESESDIGDDLWQSLQSLMAKSRVDWTLFWRQLTYVARDHAKMDTSTKTDYEDVMASLEGLGEGRTNDVSPFYMDLSSELRREWLSWLEQWSIALDQAGLLEGAYDKMCKINPKYVLREWMLVDAYTSAADEDLATLQELYELIQRPYEEGTTRDVLSYYRRATDASLTTGGTAFMS